MAGSAWTMEEDFKLLLGIIQHHCDKASTKCVVVGDRSQLSIRRRFDALKRDHPVDDTTGEVTGVRSGGKGAMKPIGGSGVEGDGGPGVGIKRKAAASVGANKKGVAKKVKKADKAVPITENDKDVEVESIPIREDGDSVGIDNGDGSD